VKNSQARRRTLNNQSINRADKIHHLELTQNRKNSVDLILFDFFAMGITQSFPERRKCTRGYLCCPVGELHVAFLAMQ
jgi:hypothetical protein